jgi:hypothetical protein
MAQFPLAALVSKAGNLAMLAAMRLASSRVSDLAVAGLLADSGRNDSAASHTKRAPTEADAQERAQIHQTGSMSGFGGLMILYFATF